MGALDRTDPPWRFWHRFSLVRDGHPATARRLWNHFWRAFSIFYFFTLITIARRGVGVSSAEHQQRDLTAWQGRLPAGAVFFGGDAPDTVDLQLFGLVQMFASVPGKALEILRRDPELERLREWAGAMQQRLDAYRHLYTATTLDPRRPAIEPASLLDRLAFWSGAATMWLGLPITLPATLFLAWRVRKRGLVPV